MLLLLKYLFFKVLYFRYILKQIHYWVKKKKSPTETKLAAYNISTSTLRRHVEVK